MWLSVKNRKKLEDLCENNVINTISVIVSVCLLGWNISVSTYFQCIIIKLQLIIIIIIIIMNLICFFNNEKKNLNKVGLLLKKLFIIFLQIKFIFWVFVNSTINVKTPTWKHLLHLHAPKLPFPFFPPLSLSVKTVEILLMG